MTVIIRRPGEEPEIWEHGTQLRTATERSRLLDPDVAKRLDGRLNDAGNIEIMQGSIAGPIAICGGRDRLVHEWDICWTLWHAWRLKRDTEKLRAQRRG